MSRFLCIVTTREVSPKKDAPRRDGVLQENDKCMIEYEKDIVIHGNYSEKNTPFAPGETEEETGSVEKK